MVGEQTQTTSPPPVSEAAAAAFPQGAASGSPLSDREKREREREDRVNDEALLLALLEFLASSQAEDNQELLEMLAEMTGTSVEDMAGLQERLRTGELEIGDARDGLNVDYTRVRAFRTAEAGSERHQRLVDSGFFDWFDPARALRTARNDDATLYECARGVGNILERQDIPVDELRLRGHGTDWDENMERSGAFTFVPCADPRNAPDGAILVYNNDAESPGGRTHSTAGGRFGHVEIAATVAGQRVFISDTARFNPGGSVRDNYVGGYYVYNPEGRPLDHASAPAPQSSATPTVVT